MVEAFLEFTLVVLVMFTVVSALVVWRTIRMVRRSRLLASWRRRGDVLGAGLADRRMMTIAAKARGGPAGELAALRVRLGQALESTDRALAYAERLEQPVGYLPRIGAELARSGASLDQQLRLAQRDPDAETQRGLVAVLKPQVESVTTSAAALRRALAEAAHSVTAHDLDAVSQDLDHEVVAMTNWSRTYTRLGRPLD